MASQNDTTTTLETAAVDQAPAEKPKRRRATKKAAAPAAADPAPAAESVTDAADAVAADAGDVTPAPVKRAPRKRAAKKAAPAAQGTDLAPSAADGEAAAPADVADSAEGTDGDAPAPAEAPKARRATKAAKSPRVSKRAKATKAPAEVLLDDLSLLEPGTADLLLPIDEDDEEAADPEAAAPADDESPLPAVPSLSMLFQAPEPVAPRRRRATAPVQAPVERPAVDDTAADSVSTSADADAADARDDVAAADDAAAADAGQGESATTDRASEDADTVGRGRRRRGGRGRRGRSQGEDDKGATASADSTDAEQVSGTGPEDSAGDTDGESVSSRRRRRRRRGAGSGDGEGDDPPGTVTRVREPRGQRDEPTAVKGSTRLEAKKQRRREGREAGRRRTIITEAEFLARRESVERVMVVRGRGDRTQIGVLEDGVLVEHYVSRETTSSMAGNVYLGRVQNVLPSMEAAFVDIGKGRNAVLYAGEVNWDAAGLEGGQARRIENALSSGDTVLVQVTKDPIGHKGARLTSQISLPGRYLVYVPEGQMTGISRKLPDTERARLKAILKEVVPDHAGVIVRTAAEGASEEELRADVERLTKIWDKIQAKAESAGAKKAGSGGAPALLHGEPDLTVRVIRDVFTEDFTSLVVSGDKAWSEVSQYVEDVAPDLAPRLQRWTSEADVFAAHRIDEAIAKAMDRKVWLPSGGSLVIDRTEAMTVVDVNTGKFIGAGGNLEETVTKNNLEAAEEIVRQLRLRDIGGIIVVDFIDMVLESNRDLVVRRLLECLGRDRTKHQVAEVTSLGLVQMTRKRVGSGLVEVFSETCEHCSGRGIVVHSEPIDRAGANDVGGANAAPSRSGRGRRGTPAAGGSSNGGSDAVAQVEEVRTPSGPTAAQIAAAAHAAALRRAEAEAAAEVPADGIPTEAEAEVAEAAVAEPAADAVEVVEVVEV
ncbi:MAG TPA: Rne/Rng family ribonuclease, partial [Ornithinibacter sp.]|nr:Rne/Rng family ribonuclease [Ornithinibacter sp.]